MKKIILSVVTAVMFAACNPYGSEIPKQLVGNWINEQNGNYDYGFFEEFAVIKNDFWKYKSVTEKEIVLENKNAQKTLSVNVLSDSTITVDGEKYFKIIYPEGVENISPLEVKKIADVYLQKMSYFPDVKEDTTDFAPYVYNRYDSATVTYYERNTAKGFNSFSRRFHSGNHTKYLDIVKMNNNGFHGCGSHIIDTMEHYGERYVFRVPTEGVSEIHNGNLLENWSEVIYLPSIIEPDDTLSFFLSRETFDVFGYRNEHYAMGNNQRFFREQDLFFNYLVSQNIREYNYGRSAEMVDPDLTSYYDRRYKKFVDDTTLLAKFVAQSKMPLSKKFVHYNKNVTLYKFASEIVGCEEAEDFFKQNPQLFNEQEVLLSYWGVTFVMKYLKNQRDTIVLAQDNIMCVGGFINPKKVKALGFSDDFVDLLRYEFFDIYKDKMGDDYVYAFTDEEKQHFLSNVKSEKYRKEMEYFFAQTGDSVFADLIKDYKGKVVLLEFFDAFGKESRTMTFETIKLEDEFLSKDVEFVYIARDFGTNWKDFRNKTKGHLFPLQNYKFNGVLNKFQASMYLPLYVIVGKDGEVKDFHTGFKGAEYYKQKFEEELGKN